MLYFDFTTAQGEHIFDLSGESERVGGCGTLIFHV